jgi:hypothetical protein
VVTTATVAVVLEVRGERCRLQLSDLEALASRAVQTRRQPMTMQMSSRFLTDNRLRCGLLPA